MFRSPACKTGVIAAAVGWLMLLFGSGLPIDELRVSGLRVNTVINIQLLSISQNIIYLGYFLILVGAISSLREVLVPKAMTSGSLATSDDATFDPKPMGISSNPRPELDSLDRRIQAAKDRAGI